MLSGVGVRVPMPAPRRRGRHIVRGDFFTKVTSHSFCRGSFPNRTRYRWAPVWVRRCAAVFSGHEKILILTSPSKRKDIRKDVLSFWAPAALGGLRPSVFECSGSAEPPLRNSRPQAGNLRATRRAAQKGRWAILLQRSCPSKISILTAPSILRNNL